VFHLTIRRQQLCEDETMKVTSFLAGAALLALLPGMACANSPAVSRDLAPQAMVTGPVCPHGCDSRTISFMGHDVGAFWQGNAYMIPGAEIVLNEKTLNLYGLFRDYHGNPVVFGPLDQSNVVSVNQRSWGAQRLLRTRHGRGRPLFTGLQARFDVSGLSIPISLYWNDRLKAYSVLGAQAAYDETTGGLRFRIGDFWVGPFGVAN
jgi:hypothetical protein